MSGFINDVRLFFPSRETSQNIEFLPFKMRELWILFSTLNVDMMEGNNCRDRRKSSVMFSDIFKVHEDDEESFEDVVGVGLCRSIHPLPSSSRPSFLSAVSGNSDSYPKSFCLFGLALIIFLIGFMFGIIVMKINGSFVVKND